MIVGEQMASITGERGWETARAHTKDTSLITLTTVNLSSMIESMHIDLIKETDLVPYEQGGRGKRSSPGPMIVVGCSGLGLAGWGG